VGGGRGKGSCPVGQLHKEGKSAHLPKEKRASKEKTATIVLIRGWSSHKKTKKNRKGEKIKMHIEEKEGIESGQADLCQSKRGENGVRPKEE